MPFSLPVSESERNERNIHLNVVNDGNGVYSSGSVRALMYPSVRPVEATDYTAKIV